MSANKYSDFKYDFEVSIPDELAYKNIFAEANLSFDERLEKAFQHAKKTFIKRNDFRNRLELYFRTGNIVIES